MNKNYLTDEYNEQFDIMMFGNVCQKNYTKYKVNGYTCEEFNNGIITRGSYSTTISTIQYIYGLINDYFEIYRSEEYAILFENDTKSRNIFLMSYHYLDPVYNATLDMLKVELALVYIFYEYRLDSVNDPNTVVFTIYIAYLIILTSIGLKYLIYNLSDEIWKSKLFLGMISPKIVIGNEEIMNYLTANSNIKLFRMGY